MFYVNGVALLGSFNYGERNVLFESNSVGLWSLFKVVVDIGGVGVVREGREGRVKEERSFKETFLVSKAEFSFWREREGNGLVQ